MGQLCVIPFVYPNMTIIPLSEGSFTVDKTKQFRPFNITTDVLQQRPAGSLLVEVQPFVIITANDIIVLDTGLGFKNEQGVLQLHNNLLQHHINPTEVTKVLMSHLHKDHAGGMSIKDPLTGLRHASFPHAQYYINEEEMDFALQKGEPSFINEDIAFFRSSGNVVYTKQKGVIDDYIFYERSGGHSPFHQVFKIVENNKIAFFGGDEAPQLVQMKTKFVAKYDFNGKKAMELRQEWKETGSREQWTFLFYHDIQIPIHRF